MTRLVPIPRSERTVARALATTWLVTSFVVFQPAASTALVHTRLLARRSAWGAALVSIAMGFALLSPLAEPSRARAEG